MDWQEFMTMNSDESKGLPPDKAFDLFSKLYRKQ